VRHGRAPKRGGGGEPVHNGRAPKRGGGGEAVHHGRARAEVHGGLRPPWGPECHHGRVPGSAWQGEAGAVARRAAWIGTAIAVVVFLLLATSGRPWTLFERGPFTSSFYDVQARALTRGHLDVPPRAAGIEGYVVDGETHFYYGLVPSVARMPISAVTTAAEGRLVVLSQLFAVAVACMAGARLLRRAQRALSLEPPASWTAWLTGAFALGIGISTPLLWLSSRTLVYHEAELWSASLTLLGLERVVVWWDTRRPRDLLWVSAVAALALSTRASPGIGPALALGGLTLVLAVRRSWRLAAWTAVAATVPIALYAAVNLARFGTPFSIPFDHQVLNTFSKSRRAALADNGGTLFGLKFVPTAVLQYLRPDTIEPRALLPWFSWGDRAHLVGNVTFDTVDRSASLPVTAPAFLAAAVPGVIVLVRRRPPAAWAISFAAAAVATLPTLSIAFIANRYLADFVPAVVVAAALGVPVVATWAARSRKRVAAWTLAVGVALALFAFVVNAGLAVLARRLYLLPDPAERRGFVAFQYEVHDALSGSRPPNVSRVDRLGPAGADGAIAIVGDCDALYRSDGDSWWLLELRPGGAQRAVLEGSSPGTVVTGDGWHIALVVDRGVRRLVYVGSDGEADPLIIEGEVLGDDGALRVDVAADPALPMVVARVNEKDVLEAFLQNARGPLKVGSGWRSIPGPTALCEELLNAVPA
jgi:hypothetical protein